MKIFINNILKHFAKGIGFINGDNIEFSGTRINGRVNVKADFKGFEGFSKMVVSDTEPVDPTENTIWIRPIP